MRAILNSPKHLIYFRRSFSSSTQRCVIKDIAQLPDRIVPSFRKSNGSDILELRWPRPPRNVLLSKKDRSPPATQALLEFAQHIASEYPDISLIAEPDIAELLNENLPDTTCAQTHDVSGSGSDLFHELPHVHTKTDLIATFGGDGTILRACSLFSTPSIPPPILSFAMGTLGFLGEWKFKDYKHAFHELYMSGTSNKTASSSLTGIRAGSASHTNDYENSNQLVPNDTRSTKVLFRRRLKVALSTPNGTSSLWSQGKEHHAMNEVLLYRGANPHLIHILIHVNGRFLTEAVADGMLVSTPTGSTAYSLSSGGSIIHPTVPALLLTPICPRSLSFRPLVLPASSEITLTLSDKNRSKEAEFSIDGLRRPEGVSIGYQIKVTGESISSSQVNAGKDQNATDICGVPFVMRGDIEGGDDGWVGGLTNLLKFNYPFAAEED